jgi:TonB-dependent Receptor Plug Domain
MRNIVFASRAAIRRQFLATTMLTALGAAAVALGPPALAQTGDQPAPESGGPTALPPVEVSGALGGAGGAPPPAPFSQPLPENIPAVVETVTANEIRQDINAVTSTDTLKYLPSIDLRTRYEGEQNPMIGFRTTSQDTPAQSLVYADGIRLSNLLGNYYFYPPVTQMVTPNEISRVDVIYGPFSALYPGNSYGGVVTFSTRMPDQFEAHLAAKRVRPAIRPLRQPWRVSRRQFQRRHRRPVQCFFVLADLRPRNGRQPTAPIHERSCNRDLSVSRHSRRLRGSPLRVPERNARRSSRVQRHLHRSVRSR